MYSYTAKKTKFSKQDFHITFNGLYYWLDNIKEPSPYKALPSTQTMVDYARNYVLNLESMVNVNDALS